MAWTRWITLWRVLAVLAIALIWIGSLWPADELRQFDMSWFNDKIGHFLGYLTVALLLALGWRQSPPWLLWLIATLSGALAELAQGYLTATRSMEWLDLMANGGGALIGIIIGVSWCRLVAPSESGVEN
ncbi:MAG: VanZ family protein [Alcanivoracaceae bacterium]|jgi:VanZ family protein|nr:VanZ family protein [Alcanivoracaceae bacterium]